MFSLPLFPTSIQPPLSQLIPSLNPQSSCTDKLLIQALSKTHVNMIDLIDALRRRRGPSNATLDAALQNLNLDNDATATLAPPAGVKVFKNIWKLEEYTRNTKRYFPKAKAKENGPLNSSLRWLKREFY